MGDVLTATTEDLRAPRGVDVVDGEVAALLHVDFEVPGVAAAQGSKRHVGRGVLVESSRAVGPWRERVALAAANTRGDAPMFGKGVPLFVRIEFVMPRPASTPRTKTPAAVKRPDLDKLARAVLDACTNVLFPDDSAVVELHVEKRLAEPDRGPYARIRVVSLEDEFPVAVKR